MPALKYSDDQVREKAVELGLVAPGEDVPNRYRGKVVAALAASGAGGPAQQKPGGPRPARSIVVQPRGDILVDGEPLPWLVAHDRIEVVCQPDGEVSTVRLTLLAEQVQITAPNEESENRA